METVMRKIGNSQGITIPKSLCDELGLSIGSPVSVSVDGKCLVVAPLQAKRPQRIGIAKGEMPVPDDLFDQKLDDEIAAQFGV